MASETFTARPVGRAAQLGMMAAPLVFLAAMAAIPWAFAVPLERVPLRAKVMMVFVPVMTAVAFFTILRFRERARLVLDDNGLRMDTGLPAWLGSAGWSIAWKDIAKVRTLSAAGVVQLQRKGSMVFRPLRVHDWVRAGEPLPPAKLLIGARDLRTAPLWQALDRRGLFARHATPNAGDFDLAKHPATRAALVVMALLMTYAAADFFLARERWAVLEPSIFAVPGAIGLVFALLAFVIFLNANRPAPIPRDVSGPLALVFGLAVACAAFYGLLRLNQWAAPLEAHEYVRNVSCNSLEPVEAGLPAIDYDDPARRYWCSFPRDKRHSVLLRRGLGGMYQVDLTEHTRGIREFNARAASAASR